MLSKEFYIGVGETQRVQLGFVALSARVDNPSTGWLTVEGQFKTGPFGFGGVVVFVPGTQTVSVVNSSLDPSGNAVVDNGQQAHVIFYDQLLPPAAPGYQQVNSVASVVVQNDLHILTSGGVSTPVGYQAADLATPSTILDGTAGNSNILLTAAHPGYVQGTVTAAAPNTAILATTTALNAVTATKVPAAALAARKGLTVSNPDAAISFAVGGAAVTFATGFVLTPGQSIPIALGPGVDVYAISASGTPNANTLEVS